MLLNVGPTAEETIIPVFQERLLQIGAWLDVNGESIYATVAWRSQNDTAANVWYTSKGSNVYAIVLSWPSNNQVVLTEPVPTSSSKVTMLGFGTLSWTKNTYGSMTINMPTVPFTKLPSPYAWVLKLTSVN